MYMYMYYSFLFSFLSDIPESIVNRHPFPGPGLAIRIICQEDALIREDFSTINSILNTIATYAQCLEKVSV